ncbi:MAG: nitroreductase/quinone reductase family protein [Actinomycetota bacterium]
MSDSERPAVQRVQPPKGPYVVINRVMRWMLSSPRRARRVGESLLLLHLTGRKTGRGIDVPVAYAVAGQRMLVLTTSGWRVNLRGRPDVEVTLRGRRLGARAELVEDPEAVAQVYGARIAEVGYAKAGRRMGIRINVDRMPTHEELAEAARRDHLSVIYLTLNTDST